VFNGASQFFATVGSPWMERDRLVAFDLNTRRARTITELSDDQFYGLAMHNGQLIGYTARNQEFALDPLTGQIKSISVVPVSGAIWGAAQSYNNVSDNPSPSSDWQQAMEREYQDTKGLLGNPTGPYATAGRSPQGTEGIWRAYETGTIHWTPQYGAVAVWLDLQREYNEHGGSGGWLGFPTQREHDWNGGKRTLFEGGYIYWDGQRAEAYRHGELPNTTPDWQRAIDQAYTASPVGLGSPISDYLDATRSPQGTTGKYRVYQNGTIHWTPEHGAVAVWLDLQREYNEQGGSGGWLGFPTKREHDWNGGKRTLFEGGFIYWDGQRAKAYRNGEFVITKEHLDKFARVAARSPEIGAAKGPIEHRGNGFLFQPFESGHIEWNGQKFVVTIYGNGNPSVSQPINTPTQGPKIINQSGESGTGRLTAGTNFRTYPWVNDSTSPQPMSAGTTFTLLEKVTTDDSTYPNWYKVRLNDGREGYFWANNVEKVGSNSGGSGGGGKAPILSQKGADYFKARPQFYTTGNIFSQSSYGSNLVDGYSYREGNCTWYAHGRVKELGGNPAALNSMYGNANQWHQQLSNGSQIVYSPQPGDIAQWTSNGQNHVAVVERVNGDGTITISESDYISNWDGGGAGSLHRVRTISASNPDRYIRVPGVQSTGDISLSSSTGDGGSATSYVPLSSGSYNLKIQIPDGFEKVDAGVGIDLYRRIDKGWVGAMDFDDTYDYVQVIRLDRGATLKLLADKKENNYLDNKDINEAWTLLTDDQKPFKPAFSVINGQIFSQDSGYRLNTFGLSDGGEAKVNLPLRIDGQNIAKFDLGKNSKNEERSQYKNMLAWNNGDNSVFFDTYVPDKFEKYDNVLVGDKHDSSDREKDSRTFLGVKNLDVDPEKEVVFLLSTSRDISQQDAYDILKSFGADDSMMLDGGSSTALNVRGENLVKESKRQVPQFIGVYEGIYGPLRYT
jgi:surface antigen